MSSLQLGLHFALEVVFVWVACHLAGLLMKKIGQPRAIGEMTAGLLLGPSLFGYLAPEVQAFVFPKETFSLLSSVSQIALALYMFIVGLEIDTDVIQKKFKVAASISIAGVAFPFALGASLAFALSGSSLLFPSSIRPFQAMLFLGAAMSITAFPMLARIVADRGLTGTKVGTLVLTAAAIDDVVSWCLLALVLASMKGSLSGAAIAVFGGIAFVYAMIRIVRPIVARIWAIADSRKGGAFITALVSLALIALAAATTEKLGLHAIFGAFTAGMAIPRGVYATQFRKKIEPTISNVFLPLFFVNSGLKTQIHLLNSATLWANLGLIMLVACAGKGIGCWAAARWSGESHRTGIAIGSLMNARGLVELVMLNIGLQCGIITPSLFAMMVMMALLTTFLASPLFELTRERDAHELAPTSFFPAR